jgi:hypothetical protein
MDFFYKLLDSLFIPFYVRNYFIEWIYDNDVEESYDDY